MVDTMIFNNFVFLTQFIFLVLDKCFDEQFNLPYSLALPQTGMEFV